MPYDLMTVDEIAFRAADQCVARLNRERRMPSGLPLAPDAADLHERAAQHLETLVTPSRARIGRQGTILYSASMVGL